MGQRRQFYLILEQPFVTPKTDGHGFIVPPTEDQIATALGRTSQRFTFVRGYGTEDSETAQGSSGMVEAARVVAAGPDYAVYDFKPGANTFIDAETGEVRFIDPRVDLNDPAAGFPYSRYGERNSRGTVRKASATSYDEYDDYDGYGDEYEDGGDFDSPELDAEADAPRSVADVCARISDEVAAAVEAEERDGWRSAGIAAAPRGHGIANYFDKGLEFGIQREVLEAVVAQFGSPKFEDALSSSRRRSAAWRGRAGGGADAKPDGAPKGCGN